MNREMWSKTGVEIMLEFVRAGVLERTPNIDGFGEIDWDELMDLSANQGVLAWVWDGICKLPKEKKPPRQQVINWGLSAQDVWDRYDYQKQVLMGIIDICRQNDIRLLLFKGIALSEFYPKPKSRSSSDIDFYLFEDYEKGNSLFAKLNVSKTNKRTGFDYKGVHIENHRIFLNAYTAFQVNAINYLEESLKDVTKTADGYYVMSPVACIVYQVMHLIAHVVDVTNPASLRLLVDIGMTLEHYRDEINNSELKEVLIRLQIDDFFSLVIDSVGFILGEDFSYFKYKQIPTEDREAMFRLVLSMDRFFVPVPKRSFGERVHFYGSNFKYYHTILKYVPNMRNRFFKKSVEVIF